jgi:hypothetical protein
LDRAGFWALIALVDHEPLRARALYALDTRAHADHAGDSGGSADGFLYARCYVVEADYGRVLADPTAMPTSPDEWCEGLRYVAREAWAERTGGDASEWPFEPSVSYES